MGCLGFKQTAENLTIPYIKQTHLSLKAEQNTSLCRF